MQQSKSKARILKKTESDRDVLDLARERMRTIYDRFDSVIVSFSGGKDSTVILNLALEVARERGRTPVHVMFFDEEAIPYQTEDYVRRVSQDPDVDLRWYCLPVRHRNACSRQSPYWYPWDPDCRELWVRELPPEGITELPDGIWTPKTKSIPELSDLLFHPKEYGQTCVLLGLRADESMMRLRSVLTRTEDNYLHVRDNGYGNLYTASPIYDWRTWDVWTAPRMLGWDYNRAYDAMDKAGIPPSQQRAAPPYGEEPLGGLWMFRECFPEIWGRMQRRVPGAATAARYARTELYGWGGITKPDGMSWQEYIRHLLNKWEPNARRTIATMIQREVRRHYEKVKDPILSTAPHPDTGISWGYLAKMAFRGNLKGRMTYPLPTGDEYDRAMAKYLEQRKEEYGY